MARHIQYEDLALSIEPDQDGGYRVRTLSSPYGAATTSFPLPLHRRELEALIKMVGAGPSLAARHLLFLEPGRDPGKIFQETGARLFRALFNGDIRTTYLLSRGRAESLPDHGLRLRIVLPADTEDAALLQSLPWELLYCDQSSDFLARNVLTPVVRQLALSQVSISLPDFASPRLRILIAVASPGGVPLLDDIDERARILEAWCQEQRAEVKLLLPATLRDLHETVRSNHYHVVHFIAHGFFDAETGVGSLLLENSDGEPHAVSGALLAETLRASRELRLVFLNSCESAQVGHRRGQDPLLGTAAALVRRGVPAVIAMQFPISDMGARVFSEAVYRSLARGTSLEAAVADGRLALFQAEPDSWEWITPALFAALSESNVFRPLLSATEVGSARSPDPPPDLPRAPYRRLCGRATWLGKILAELRDPRGNLVIAIQGMGGIGKTALAHEVVHRALREGFCDTALWLQAARPVAAWMDQAVAPSMSMTFEEVLDKILQHCGASNFTESGLAVKIGTVEKLLKKRRSILVLDNMETAHESQEEIIRQLLPILAVTPTRVIVTSRERFEHLVFSVSLTGLGAKGSRELLLMEAHLRSVPSVWRASEEELDTIAEEVGGSPLALKLVVGQLQYLPTREVLDRLRDVRLRRDGEDPNGDEYTKFYRHLFWASWRLLAGNEDARQVLLLLSWYEPLQGAPWSRLLEVSGLQEKKRFSEAIHALWKLSLVETDSDEGLDDMRYYLHPLTQFFAESMEDQEEAC